MRIFLQTFHILLLYLLFVVSAAMAGGLATMIVGYGPAAMAAGLIVLVENFVIILSFLAGILPVILVSAANLVIVFASGYRFLRWMRYLNLGINCLAGIYFIWLFSWDNYGIGLAVFLLVLGILSLLVPKKPNIHVTRKVIYYLQYGIYLFVMLPMFWVILTVEGLTLLAAIGTALFFLGLWLVYFNGKLTLQTDGGLFSFRFYKRMAISGVLSFVYTLLLPIYGVPLFLGWVLILQLTEEVLLYPVAMPVDKSKYWHFVRIFGRFPEDDITKSKDEYNENKREEKENEQKEEPRGDWQNSEEREIIPETPEFGTARGDD